MPEGTWKYTVVPIEEARDLSLQNERFKFNTKHFLNNSSIIFNQIIHYSEITLWGNR